MSDFSAKRVAGLDAVRSAAILFVVIGHYWPLYERFPAASPLKVLGILGVELFFVLSGFLIGGILLRDAAELETTGRRFEVRHAPHFWMRRWFRTLPNYVLFFGLFLLYHQPWNDGQWRPWFLSVFFLQNLWVDLTHGTFGVAWSLCVEEWLYILLPLVLAAYSRTPGRAERAALFTALTLIVIPTILRFTTAGKLWDLGVRHIVIYRLDAIAYGVLLAYFCRYRSKVFNLLSNCRSCFAGVAGLIGITVFLLIFGLDWTMQNDSRQGIKWLLLSVFLFSALSIAIIPIVAWSSRLGALPWGFRGFVYRTSLYSYSMYLSHLLVYYFALPTLHAALVRFFGEFRGMTFVLMALNITALYAFSALVFHLWESPLTRMRERFSPSRHATQLDRAPSATIPHT